MTAQHFLPSGLFSLLAGSYLIILQSYPNRGPGSTLAMVGEAVGSAKLCSFRCHRFRSFQKWMLGFHFRDDFFLNIDMCFAALQGIMMFIKGHSNLNFFLVKLSAFETCMYFSETLWRNGKQRNQTIRPIWKILKVSLNIKQCILSLLLMIFYSKIGKQF